jgi:hypothetical protein
MSSSPDEISSARLVTAPCLTAHKPLGTCSKPLLLLRIDGFYLNQTNSVLNVP